MNEVAIHVPLCRMPAPEPVLRTLAPIGVGTGMVESMNSYVSRLAVIHRVSRIHVEQLVNSRGDVLFIDQSTQPFRLDAPTTAALEFARRLAQMARQPDVARLGMGWLQPHWAPPQSLKSHQAWCPECLGEMDTPYLPLAWSLKSCIACPKHHRLLVDSCPSCGHRQSERRVGRAAIGHCDGCGSSLALDAQAPASEADEKPRRPVRCDLSSLTLELLEDLQRSPSVISSGPDVRGVVTAAIGLGHVENAAALAQRACVSKGTLHGSQFTTANPTMEVLLRLCVAGRVAPGSLFGLRTAGDPGSLAAKASALFLPTVRKNLQHDWKAIRHSLLAAMQERETVPSVAEFAARHEVGIRELRLHWPAMAGALTRLHRERLARDRMQAVEATAAMIREAAAELSRAGFRPTARRIAEQVAVRRASPIFASAMKRVMTGDLPQVKSDGLGELAPREMM